jgi:putative Mg2+ transporter-C (MgtC) family protein
MVINPDDIFRLLLSLALGGLIGTERELRDKAAGLRTLMFICAGSALFTIFSTRLAEASGSDPTRISAQIVTGIGFLGAGVILRDGGTIRGLTTAATIWLTAALGMGVGGGQILFSTLTTIIILLALWIFPSLERLIGRVSQVRTYQVTAQASQEKYSALCNLFYEHHLRVQSSHRSRKGSEMICTWTVSGLFKNHEAISREFFEDNEIQSFEV